jgi:hypothetical protein
MLRDEAALLACAVAPERACRIPASRSQLPPRFGDMRRVRIMLEHGHLSDAAAFLKEHASDDSYPFMALPSVLERCTDDETKLALLRRAVAVWRAAPAREFLSVFAHYWRLLPEPEARQILHELVDWTLREPDTPMRAQVDPNDLLFIIDSSREYQLYELLNVLRRLDPDLADSLIAQHRQLAAAAARFPMGTESMAEAARRKADQPGAAGEGRGGGYVMVGSSSDMPYQMRLMEARGDGNFDPPFEDALGRYASDTDPEHPNHAIKECWPSAHMFRSILFAAGKRLGADAEGLLDRIPDPDLRLFAMIELAAALAGLPQYSGTTRTFSRRPPAPGAPRSAITTSPGPGTAAGNKPGNGPTGPRIRCPRCGWTPNPSCRWQCGCGHTWHTFDTGGVCPGCMKRWESTECPRCHAWSPHSDWYVYD